MSTNGSGPLVEVKSLKKYFPIRKGILQREVARVHAVDDVTFGVNEGETIGLVSDPLRIHGIGDRAGRKKQVEDLLQAVGLSPEHYNRFPHEFSGGQRQRIGVARALALRPKLIVADEPVSALDVSIQSQMLNLLEDLQRDFRLTYIFIAHDLGVVRHVSDRIAVMYLGKLVELSPAEELYSRPIMPYTEALLSAVPIPDPAPPNKRGRIGLQGEVPSPIEPPPACRFHPRCRYATDICKTVEPPLVDYGGGHFAACHHPRNVTEAMVETALQDGAEVQEPSGMGHVLGAVATGGDGDGAAP